MSFYKTAIIEYDYVKRKGRVYYKWRFPPQRRWNYKLTPYKEIPIVRFKPWLEGKELLPFEQLLIDADLEDKHQRELCKDWLEGRWEKS